MIRQVADTWIVELYPNVYWVASGGPSFLTTPDASEATRVDKSFDLDKRFALQDYPQRRLVNVEVTVTEKKSPAYHRYITALTDMFGRYIIAGSLSEDQEEHYAAEMQKLRSQFTSTDEAQIEHDVATAPRQGFKVYLDDQRPTPNGWIRTRTASGTINVLAHTNITHLSLDHDLGEGHGTGYQVACWLEEAVLLHGYPMPVVTIHSDNGVGRENIQRALDSIYSKMPHG